MFPEHKCTYLYSVTERLHPYSLSSSSKGEDICCICGRNQRNSLSVFPQYKLTVPFSHYVPFKYVINKRDMPLDVGNSDSFSLKENCSLKYSSYKRTKKSELDNISLLNCLK